MAGKRTCAVMQQHNYLVSVDASYRATRRMIEADTKTGRLATRTAVIQIPVVVHVIYHTDAENISDDQIFSQIDALNRDYRFKNEDRVDIPPPFKPLGADMLIEFGLAVRDPEGKPTTGITRTKTTQTSFPYDRFDQQATDKLDKLIKEDAFGKAAWPRESYLNLWVCNIDGGLLGYAQFPGGPAATDGVVIWHKAFGRNGTAATPYDNGRTAVHEVGHWLNLLHIWGDDDGECTRSDEVSDTPNQANSNGSDVKRGSFPHITCTNAPNGDMFMNYMDYVDDDTMVMFTKGQLVRVNATLSGPRASLAKSQGLVPVESDDAALTSFAVDGRAARAAAAADLHGHGQQYEFDGVEWVPRPR